MVSSSHEAMHRIFHHDSEMLGRTFHALGLSLPTPDTVSVISGDVTEIRPMERRIDTLLRCETAEGEAYLVLVESQRGVDEDKRYTWTYYLAYLADKYRLPVLLLVICHDRRVATWAAQPFKHGAGAWAALTLRAVVVGPHNVPAILDEEAARDYVPLAVLSALTHAKDADIGAILKTLASALKAMDDPEEAYDLAELTGIGLGDTPADEIWRQMMALDTSFYRSSFSRQLRAEGHAEGRAEGAAEGRAASLRRVLDIRGIAITEEQGGRLSGCTDLDQLDAWLDRALTATSASEVFDVG
ncbi:hypothetical protein KGQ20_32595 [Catenulispora sp. NF23]|uniref:hypothetical protein n=1 Tax=Catenulispora pinistramenti TaxID=2705254 RepID=UPI001BAAE2B2|nr:hypothetical protein [Catenulispora pinistramenti]MBS2537503.1 hypothetical protein [Catenulispora pinistramenti]